MMEAIEETGSKAKLGLSGTDWMDYKQGLIAFFISAPGNSLLPVLLP
jgi:hypothetical protein